MSKTIEITQEKYDNVKRKVLESTIIQRVEVQISKMEIVNLTSVRVEGFLFELDQGAVKGLLSSLGINKQFITILKDAYQDDKILNTIMKAVKSKKTAMVILVFNRLLNKVTNIYNSESKVVEDSQYFDVLESMISKTPGAYLRNIDQDSRGNLSAVIANPKLEFQFGGMAAEVFTSGFTLDLNSVQMNTSFFTERLWCANGCSIKDKLCSRSVKVSEKVPDFVSHVLEAEYHLTSIEEFKKRINRCYHTTASLSEVLKSQSKISGLLGEHAPSLTRNMSSDRLRMAFGPSYLEDKTNHKYLKTDITLWDLVNEITAVSSDIEQNRVALASSVNLDLQILGGDLMFSKPDLIPANIKQLF